MNLRQARPEDADALATVHATGFGAPWPAADMREMMAGPGVHGLLAEDESVAGFVLVRAIAGEAEILTIAVDPARRRRGVARALMTAATGWAEVAGAQSMFLEVAEDNPAALALYDELGFETAGTRRAYYARAGGPRVDARVMRRALNRARP
jgi:ribosomal-protein-alanine N-acetyltransferase